MFNHSENSDLLNIRDEILANLNKLSYLLTLHLEYLNAVF